MFILFDFKEKNYFRAFFLPSLVTAISSTIAIEYSYVRKVLFGDKNKKGIKYHLREAIITFLSAFITSFFAFYIIHMLTGFGNSMLHTKVSNFKENV